MKRVELPNGLTLLLYEDHRLPIITAQAELHRVNVFEPDDKLGVARADRPFVAGIHEEAQRS